MKQWFTGLLAETENSKAPSMTRFLSLICVSMACIIASVTLYKGLDLEGAAVLCSVFLGGGLGSKVWQKKYETEEEPIEEPKKRKKDDEEEEEPNN